MLRGVFSPQASTQDATFGTPSCRLLLDSILENKVGAFDGHGEQDKQVLLQEALLIFCPSF